MAAEWATMIDEAEDDSSPEFAGADRILIQEEIDQLLGFSLHEMSASGAGGIRAIVDSGVVSYERLPMLEIHLRQDGAPPWVDEPAQLLQRQRRGPARQHLFR